MSDVSCQQCDALNCRNPVCLKIQTLQEQNKAQAEEIERMKADREVLVVALTSIAFFDEPSADTKGFWLTLGNDKIHETMANDTAISRQALKSIGALE